MKTVRGVANKAEELHQAKEEIDALLRQVPNKAAKLRKALEVAAECVRSEELGITARLAVQSTNELREIYQDQQPKRRGHTAPNSDGGDDKPYWKRKGWRKEMMREIGQRYATPDGYLDVERFAFSNLIRDANATTTTVDLVRKYEGDAKEFCLRSDSRYFFQTFKRLFPEIDDAARPAPRGDPAAGLTYVGVRFKTESEVARDAEKATSPDALRPLTGARDWAAEIKAESAKRVAEIRALP